MLNRMEPMYDAETNDGGMMEVMKKVEEQVGKVGVEVAETSTEVAKIAEELATAKVDSDKDILALSKQVSGMKDSLAKSYGKSGSEDFLNDMSKFLVAIYRHKNGMKVEGEIGGQPLEELVSNKTLITHTTTTAATSGVLLPDLLLPGITDLKSVYGTFYPEVTKVSVGAGQSLQINRQSLRPVATWRGTQGDTIVEDPTPLTFVQDTIVTELLGTFITVANELFLNPAANVTAVFTMRMVRAIVTALEFGLISGTAAGVQPSNGIIADAGGSGTIASMTFALFGSVVKLAVAANPHLYNTTDNVAMMTPGDAVTLGIQQGTSAGALVWGNPQLGIPTTLMGYRLLTHPSLDNGSDKHVVIGDPSMVTLGEDPSLTVDVSNTAGNSFIHNESIIRAFGHYDWNVGQPTEWFKSIVTA